jgi:hypothetical protein
MKNETETRGDNTVNYTYSTNVPISKPKEPIYKYDLFGDNWTMVGFIYEKNCLPNWFRRQCQRFFLGTKWTKL